MVVWEKIDSFAGESKLSTWIFTIAYRKAMKALRRLDEPVEDPDADSLASHHPSPDHNLGQQRVSEALEASLDGAQSSIDALQASLDESRSVAETGRLEVDRLRDDLRDERSSWYNLLFQWRAAQPRKGQ